ncbi:MAG: hypothetical protein HYY44_04880 [Deltaproteobacteria bacterium]|nr:hypothetical protein [Deltaproteobacteria bacterium]
MQKNKETYQKFLHRVEREIMSHRIIHDNRYTRWFREGNFTLEDLRRFAVQFSVFSNLFILAQLRKTFNASTLEEMRESKEILMNELGVVFKKTIHDVISHRTSEMVLAKAPDERGPRRTVPYVEGLVRRATKDNGISDVLFQDADYAADPLLVSPEGTVQGGLFRFEAAHFEWLLNFIKPLGLEFNDVGKRKQAIPSTLRFTDGLERIYGSDDFSEGAGASFAIEHWAAAGFWKELTQGLKKFREKSKLKLNLGFWTFHDRLEEQHAVHTEEELQKVYFYENFNEDKFIQGGREMLDDCAVFWDGLDEERLKRNR